MSRHQPCRARLNLALLALLAVLTLRPDSAAADGCTEQAEQVAAELESMRRQGDVPAMGVSIFCGGSPVIVAGYGAASADTPFRWGSITKSVTGLAALQLLATTELTLESPVRPIVGPGIYQNPWADTAPLKISHLLALSAGLPDLNRAEWNDNEPRPLWQALERHQDERQMLWPPGLQHSYSNVPPGLTAAVIERASEQPFETFLEQRLFRPLGMQGASLAPVPGLPGGFRADGETEIPYWHMTFTAFGALNASTREMTRLLSALLNNGQLEGRQPLAPELVATFFRPAGTLADGAGLAVGYGAGVYGWVRGGQLFHGHGGDADGYLSRYGLLREEQRGYLLVINTDNPRLFARMRRTLEDALIADLPAVAPAASQPAVASELEALSGDYYPASSRFRRDDWANGKREQVQVRRSGASLVLTRGGKKTHLHPAGDGRFYRDNDPAVSTVFVRDATGSLYLLGEPGNFARISPGPCPDFLRFCD